MKKVIYAYHYDAEGTFHVTYFDPLNGGVSQTVSLTNMTVANSDLTTQWIRTKTGYVKERAVNQ